MGQSALVLKERGCSTFKSVNVSVVVTEERNISFKNHNPQCSNPGGWPLASKWPEGLDPSINSRYDSRRKVRAPLIFGNPRSGQQYHIQRDGRVVCITAKLRLMQSRLKRVDVEGLSRGTLAWCGGSRVRDSMQRDGEQFRLAHCAIMRTGPLFRYI